MQDVALIDIWTRNDSVDVLYELLKEREEHESIAHKRMPSYDEHLSFVAGQPYLAWYLVMVAGTPVGSVYLTYDREIGAAVLKKARGHGYGARAISMLMLMHPGRFRANINPANQKSVDLFRKLGFGLIQHTYAL